MKAKHLRNLARSETAVSPIIAVILMVAITVVLAAIVFVLLRNIETGAPSMTVGFHTDRAQARATVQQANPGADWSNLALSPSQAMKFQLNGGPWTALPTGWTPASTIADNMGAGETVSFCRNIGQAYTFPLRVDARDNAGNALVASFEFDLAPECPCL